MAISLQDYLFRVLLAMVLGFVIGAERQIKGHPAGIRTNVLVCTGACFFVLFPIIVGADDITRAGAQVVTGVGFLGSGIIFKEGLNVKGVNTAATLWCTAAIGVLSSSGHPIPAILGSIFIICGNVILRPIAHKLTPAAGFDENENFYHITIVCGKEQETTVRQLIIKRLTEESKIALTRLESFSETYSLTVRIAATFKHNEKRIDEVAEDLVEKISQLENIRQAGWLLSDH